MRQKLIMSSDKVDIKYERAPIQKLFLRILERGILSQMVLQEVKYLLRQDPVCYKELLSAITKAACYEQEKDVHLRKSKNLKQHQHVFKASVCSPDPKSNKASSNSSDGDSGIGGFSSDPVLKLTAVIESLTLQLSSLQNDICGLNDKDLNRDRLVHKKCKTCNKANVNSRYTHCYLCESNRNYTRNCDKNQHHCQGN